MPFDNLDDIHVLLATAEAGGLTAAGRRVGLSTAAVSAAIKRLEAQLGMRLFERTTRVVRPTVEGLVMIDHARRALDLLAQGHARARGGAQALTGTLRVTLSAAMAHEMLAQHLADFAQMHPALNLDVWVSDTHLDLVKEGIDLALRHGPLADSSHTARLLAPACRVACASPAYLAAHGRPEHPSQLTQHNCLIYQARDRDLDLWWFEPIDDGSLNALQVKVRGRLHCNDASIAQQWALHGRGVLYQTELALSRALGSGQLVRLFPQFRGEATPLYALLPSGRYVPGRVQALVDYLSRIWQPTPNGLSVAPGGLPHPVESLRH